MFMEKLTHVIPFMALVTRIPKEIHNRPLLTRLTEQVLVGIVAAAVGVYVNDIRQTEQISNLSTRLERAIDAQKESNAEIKQIITKMQGDLYVPVAKSKGGR